MAHQDFHQPLNPLAGDSPAKTAERKPGGWDIGMSFVLGLAAMFLADMVELYIVAGGSAEQFLNGDGWLYGNLVLMVLIYLGIEGLGLRGLMVVPMVVAGVLVSALSVGYLTVYAPAAAAMLYTPDYIVLLSEGYSHQGLLSAFF